MTGGMKGELKDEREDKIGTLVVLGLLRGLHGLPDLHADDVDLGLAVLQHLLSRLEKLLVLREGHKNPEETVKILQNLQGQELRV